MKPYSLSNPPILFIQSSVYVCVSSECPLFFLFDDLLFCSQNEREIWCVGKIQRRCVCHVTPLYPIRLNSHPFLLHKRHTQCRGISLTQQTRGEDHSVHHPSQTQQTQHCTASQPPPRHRNRLVPSAPNNRPPRFAASMRYGMTSSSAL
jgi:hypothetical protein